MWVQQCQSDDNDGNWLEGRANKDSLVPMMETVVKTETQFASASYKITRQKGYSFNFRFTKIRQCNLN